MTLEELSEDLLLVTLPERPLLGKELARLRDIADDQTDRAVVIDLSRTEVLTYESLTCIVILHTSLADMGRRLIICNLSASTRRLFERMGLDQMLTITNINTTSTEPVPAQCSRSL